MYMYQAMTPEESYRLYQSQQMESGEVGILKSKD